MKYPILFILPLLMLASCAAPSLTEPAYRAGGRICKHPLSHQGQLSAEEMEQVNTWLDERCRIGTRSLKSYIPYQSFRSGAVDISLALGGLIVIEGSYGQYAVKERAEDAPILRLLQLKH